MWKSGTLFRETKNPTDGTDRSPPTPPERLQSTPRPTMLDSVPPEEREEVENKAILETAKEEIKQKKAHGIKISNLVARGRVYLYRTCSVFPFDLFPDEISIEPDQVNICINSFFMTAKTFSIPIKNIAEIYLYTTPFFASLRVIDKSYIENSIEITYLKKLEAEKARRIIQGLILASKENVDLSKIEPKKLKRDAERIGSMQGVVNPAV